ncbi:MAG: hypothetical protein U0172_05090 [Nitrospiraceae bacterium]
MWDRRTDRFTLGQWFKGRIYERRCDLSPDGTHLLYFALDGKWQELSQGSWSAISRAPYLKALAFFPKGDCWQGGGLFLDNSHYWLNGYGCHWEGRNSTHLQHDDAYQPIGGRGGECLGVYYPRLLRDGWTLREQLSAGVTDQCEVFEKPFANGWVLRKYAHAQVGSPAGKGCYWDEHELVHSQRNRSLPQPQWEWADVDGTRLVWAEAGSLWTGTLTDDGITALQQLHDFNPLTFERRTAPY